MRGILNRVRLLKALWQLSGTSVFATGGREEWLERTCPRWNGDDYNPTRLYVKDVVGVLREEVANFYGDPDEYRTVTAHAASRMKSTEAARTDELAHTS